MNATGGFSAPLNGVRRGHSAKMSSRQKQETPRRGLSGPTHTLTDGEMRGPMAPFIFTCPNTDLKVQHWLDDDDDTLDGEYEGIICPACSALHFIDRKTGRLFGQNEE
jgi:hypothetical protein